MSGGPWTRAAGKLTIPAHFAGPIPHAHDEFDEAIYVLSGRLLVVGEDEPREAVPGSMFVASRGCRHGFSNPSGEQDPVEAVGLFPAVYVEAEGGVIADVLTRAMGSSSVNLSTARAMRILAWHDRAHDRTDASCGARLSGSRCARRVRPRWARPIPADG